LLEISTHLLEVECYWLTKGQKKGEKEDDFLPRLVKRYWPEALKGKSEVLGDAEGWGRRRRRRRRKKKGFFSSLAKKAKKAASTVSKVAKRGASMVSKVAKGGVKGFFMKKMMDMLRKYAKKYRVAHLFDTIKKPMMLLLTGKAADAKKMFIKTMKNGKLVKAISTDIVPQIIIFMVKRGKQYRAGKVTLKDAAIGALRDGRANCKIVRKLNSFADPTFVVTDQGWVADGPKGFFNKKRDGKFKWTLFWVRAPRKWYTDAAKKHSDCKGGKCKTNKAFKNSNALSSPKSAVDLCWTQKKNECPMVPKLKDGRHVFLPGLHPPTCMAKFEVTVDKCSTCCCRGGVIKSGVASNLIVDGNVDCQTWFSALADAAVRAMVLALRAAMSSKYMSTPCYEPAWKARHNLKGKPSFELGEEAGRRGGGSMGSTGNFALSQGSNRAGNDEALL